MGVIKEQNVTANKIICLSLATSVKRKNHLPMSFRFERGKFENSGKNKPGQEKR